jgi:hypothetical protein
VNLPADEAAQPRAPRAGFALPRDILIAPARAFAAIKARPEWLPAALIVLVLSIAGTILAAPALAHVMNAAVAPSRAAGGNISVASVDAAIKQELLQLFFNQTLFQLAAWGLTGMVLTTASRLRGQATSFATYFSLAANCGVTTAIGFALEAFVIRLRDPNSYANLNQFNTAFPLTLAVLDPHGSTTQVAFLAQYDIFFLWTGLLVAYGYMSISGEKPVRALFLAFGIAFSLSLIGVLVQP